MKKYWHQRVLLPILKNEHSLLQKRSNASMILVVLQAAGNLVCLYPFNSWQPGEIVREEVYWKNVPGRINVHLQMTWEKPPNERLQF